MNPVFCFGLDEGVVQLVFSTMQPFPRFPGYEGRSVRSNGPTLRAATLRSAGASRARSPSSSAVSTAEAQEFVQAVLQDIGIDPRFPTRGQIELPFLPNRRIRLPSTTYELLDTMDIIRHEYNSYVEANRVAPGVDFADDPAEPPDDEPQGPHGPQGPIDFDQAQGPVDVPPPGGGDTFMFRVEVTSYNQNGEEVQNVYNVEGTLQDYNFLADESNEPAERVQLFYTLAGTNEAERYLEGLVDSDAKALPFEAQGAGAAAVVVPGSFAASTELPFYQQTHYRDPLRRLSWDSGAPFVDHVGVRYDPKLILERAAGRLSDRTFRPRDPYLRHNYVPDLCWFNAIIDLVNTRMNRPWMTYDKLWINYLKQQGCFQPEVACLGMNIQDVIPVFEHLDRKVTVLDGEGTIIYSRERTSRRFDHIAPHHWVFIMTENHVYHVNPDLDQANSTLLKRHLRFAPNKGSYEIVLEDYPYESILPFFPSRERQLPALLSDLQHHSKRKGKKQAPTYLLFLVQDPSPEEPDHATLSEVLFHDRYQDANLTVLVQADLLSTVLMPLIQKYAYRPSVFGSGPNDVHCVTLRSLGDRGIIRFVTPFVQATAQSAVLPSLAEPRDGVFTDQQQYIDFLKAEHNLYSTLVSPNLISTMHETVHQVCRTFMRGGLHGWLVPPPQLTDPSMHLASLDMNRVYPSTLKAGWVPTCNVFDRFVSTPTLYDPIETQRFFDEELEDEYLCLVYVHDTPSCYLERGAALCFKVNLKKFLRRSGVVLMAHGGIPAQSAEPSGCHTYVQVVAYLPTRKTNHHAWEAVVKTWEAPVLPRWMRKKALVRSLGKLGRSCNQKYREAAIFMNFQEAQVCAENSNGRMANLNDEVFLAFRDGDRVPRLEGGYLMHLFVLDSYRLALQEAYDQIVEAGITPLYVRADEFFFPSDQLPLAEKCVYQGDPECVAAFGKLKVGHQEIAFAPAGPNPGLGCFSLRYLIGEYLNPSMEDYVTCDEEINKMERAHTKCMVQPFPDEFDLQNIYDHHRLLIRANVPGAGKSHAVLSRFAKETVVVCPTNALCVAFQIKYPGVTAMTLHRFLRVNADLEANPERRRETEQQPGMEESIISFREKQPEFNKVLLLDEIFMYPLALLGRLYFRLATTPAKRVYATGDPNQLPPVHEESGDSLANISEEKARRMKAVDLLFPRQMELRVCKRAHSAEDNKRMAALCLRMRNPGFTMGMVRDLVKCNFAPLPQAAAIESMRAHMDKYISVCYYNFTCSKIAAAVLPHGDKAAVGIRLVNRGRRQCKSGGVLMVNYEYDVVERQSDKEVTLECVMTKNRFVVPFHHVKMHMHWCQTRTCHSLQGSSVDGAIILWDLESPRITPEFIYVAMTRARSLGEVYYVV